MGILCEWRDPSGVAARIAVNAHGERRGDQILDLESVIRRRFDVIHHENLHRPSALLEFQAKLLL